MCIRDRGNTVVSGNLTINGTLNASQLTGTADNADNINIDEANGNTNYQVTFSALNNAGYNRQYIDTDDSHLVYNPGTAALSGLTTLTSTNVNATTFTGALSGNASSATQLQTARNIGGVSFNGTADITLPGVNSGGNQDTSGTAAKATDININETANNQNYQVTFSEAGAVTSQSGNHYRQLIDNDNGHFLYNPSTQYLSGLNILATTVLAGTIGTIDQNSFGVRTVSTNGPSGGNDGDIWYKY